MIKKLTNEFINPDSKYRGVPFWAWNGELEVDELRQQIRDMHKMGLGGFFMHSRVGLETDYLSPKWFECIKACIDEAEKLDMQAWLYDEDRWPSGTAGGMVTSNPQYRSRILVAEEIESPDEITRDVNTMALYSAVIGTDGRRLIDLKRLENLPPSLFPGVKLLHFYECETECSSWYNGQTYLDTLNHEAVNKFIEITHEAYRREVGNEFGKRVPGIFTDEPTYGHICLPVSENKCGSPWTYKLPDIFRERYGYDLLEHLPELFYDVEDNVCFRTRVNYIDCLTFLFSDAFSKQVGEWCAANDMLFTGHPPEEDTLSMQTHSIGAVMRMYEYMQAPGMDLLTEHRRLYDTAKQVSSVARQFGRKWRLTETYGGTGWDFPFAGHKALGDWQAALGINVRCQHLAWYTMQGEAKRDYPGSIFYQSPWWREYVKVEDYFARINLIMSQGEEIRDLLVIHPVESVWGMIGKNWQSSEIIKKWDEKLCTLRDCLLEANIDFDYGDEDILYRYGSVEIRDGIAVLKINQAEYKAVVVPAMMTVRASTLKILREFKQAGGEVVFSSHAAEYVDAQPSFEAKVFARECGIAFVGASLIDRLDSLARRISITSKNGKQIEPVLFLHKEDADCTYLFVCNTGHLQSPDHCREDHTRVLERTSAFPEVEINIKTEKTGSIVELDPESGKVYVSDAERTTDGWRIRTSFAALGSRLFIASDAPASSTLQLYPKLKVKTETTVTPAVWNIALTEHNVLLLDRADLKIAGESVASNKYILEIDDMVRKYLGIPQRGGQMKQPWVRKHQLSDHNSVTIELIYKFNCERIPFGPLLLGIERLDLFNILINNIELSPDSDNGWWCDHSLRTLPVSPEILHLGSNELRLRCNYSEAHPGLESVYLLGDFGVNVAGLELSLTVSPQQLSIGDWCQQGLPFYSGAVKYLTEIAVPDAEQIIVKLPKFNGVCTRIYIEQQDAGIIAWPPYELDITEAVSGKTKCMLTVEIVSSRRNSHGPMYQKYKHPNWTGPSQYREYTGNYQLVQYGLLAPPVIIAKVTK